jgi:hypothetical protein
LDNNLQNWLTRQVTHFLGDEECERSAFDHGKTIQIAKKWLMRTYGIRWGKNVVKRARGCDGTHRITRCHPSADALRLSVLGVGLHAHTKQAEEHIAAQQYWDECTSYLDVHQADKDYLMREIQLADYSTVIPTMAELKRRTACKVGLAGQGVTTVPLPPHAPAAGWDSFDAEHVMVEIRRVIRCLHVTPMSCADDE